MKRVVGIICVLLFITSCQNRENQKSAPLDEVNALIQPVDTPRISAPPTELNLDPFYKKYMNVNGIHVISSWRVPDSCFYAAYRTIKALTDMLPKEVLKSMTGRDTRIGIMARYEGTTDIPEHAYLANDTSLNWDVRARGLGGTLDLPLTTCAEENILAYQIDKYHAEDILIHEFAHTIHDVGISPVNPDFNDRLKALLDAALKNGRWVNTYAATDIWEYWAEGVQNWFNINAEVDNDGGDGKHNKVNTRQELEVYDPGLYEILSEYFPKTDKRISRHKTENLYNWEISKNN
jgi:alpha-glucosidase